MADLTTREGIVEAAISTYGIDAQLDMAVEEMAELTKAIMKYRRDRDKPDKLIGRINDVNDEVADVEIMCLQLRKIFDPGNEVSNIKGKKLLRLAKRLDPSISLGEVKPDKSIGDCIFYSDNWISVNDRLPEKFVPVLAIENSEFNEMAVDMVLDDNTWDYLSSNQGFVTHWQPLPDSPTLKS